MRSSEHLDASTLKPLMLIKPRYIITKHKELRRSGLKIYPASCIILASQWGAVLCFPLDQKAENDIIAFNIKFYVSNVR